MNSVETDLKFKPIITDKFGKEITDYSYGNFELSMDRQKVSDPLCHSISHWHPEIQISVVLQGCVKFRIADTLLEIHQGQGLFLNSSCRHEIVLDQDTRDGVYLCANFDPSILSTGSHGTLYQSYIEPVIKSPQLQYIELKDEGWHQQVCGLILQMGEVDKTQAYGFEIELLRLLLEIWQLIVANSQDKIDSSARVSFSDRSQIYVMQKYIHKHYMDDISLADIAATAHISVGECCRIFSRSLNTSPIQYLINHRINQSLKLLTGSDLSIGEIAQQVGYGSSSHFTSSFKKLMQMTPMNYRMNQIFNHLEAKHDIKK